MDYETELAKLAAAARGASFAYKAIAGQRDEEIRIECERVKERITAKYRDRTKAAYEASREAYQAEQNFINANASHPWEGKRVVRTVDTTGRWSRTKTSTEEFGIVEICRRDTELPGNMRYGLPDLGQAFVRLLKADGTPGLKLDGLGAGNWKKSAWRLADEGEK